MKIKRVFFFERAGLLRNHPLELRRFLTGLALTLWAMTVSGAWPTEPQAATPARQVLSLRNEFAQVLPFDLRGKNKKDLLVVMADRNQRPVHLSLSIFHLEDNGYGPATKPIKLPLDTVMVGVGQFTSGPGLAILTSNKVMIWPYKDDRFVAEEAKSMGVSTMFFGSGDIKTDLGWEWVADLTGDGKDELLIPGLNKISIVREQGNELALHAVVPYAHISRVVNLLSRRTVNLDLPKVEILAKNAKGWRDVLTFNDNQLNIKQLSDQAQPTASADLVLDFSPNTQFAPGQVEIPSLMLQKAGDLNGDGLTDLVMLRSDPTDSALKAKTSVLVFYGKANTEQGKYPIQFSTQPDQSFVAEGFAVPIIKDITGDGHDDIVMVNMEMGLMNIGRSLFSKSFRAEASYYLMGSNNRYPKLPDHIESYLVHYSLGRYDHQPILAFGDLNGDRKLDLILSTDTHVLGVHYLTGDGYWPEEPDTAVDDLLPIHERRLLVTDLDRDSKDDLVITFNRDDSYAVPKSHKTLIVRFTK